MPEMAGVPFRTTAAAAPFAAASARNACPSNRSPSSATYSAPGASVRVSVETDTKAASAVGREARVARATSSAVKSPSVEAVPRLLEDVVHDRGQTLRSFVDLALAVRARPAREDRVHVFDLLARAELVHDVVHELEELAEE